MNFLKITLFFSFVTTLSFGQFFTPKHQQPTESPVEVDCQKVMEDLGIECSEFLDYMQNQGDSINIVDYLITTTSQVSSGKFDNVVYAAMLAENDELSYVVPGPFTNIIEQDGYDTLRKVEGTKNIAEANITQNFKIIRAERLGNRFRLSVYGAVNLRLINAGEGQSSPSLPPSNKVGIRIDGSPYGHISSSGNRAEYVYLTLLAYHYSNGQGPGSKYPDDATGIRNDYASGDFSTNVLHAALNYATSWRKLFVSPGIHYQWDGGLGSNSILQYIETQEGRYGNRRLGLDLNAAYNLKKRNSPESNKIGAKLHYVKVQDDLDLDRKWNWNFRAQLYFKFVKLGDWGIMAQYYRGRDYLNIRYDLPITSFTAGVMFFP